MKIIPSRLSGKPSIYPLNAQNDVSPVQNTLRLFDEVLKASFHFSDEDISGSEEDFDMKELKDSKNKTVPERKADTAIEEGRVIFLRYFDFNKRRDIMVEPQLDV